MTIEELKINQCRGIESTVMDTSSDIAVIKAPVAEVSKAVTQFDFRAQLYSNALNGVIRARNRGIIFLQLKGFEWTILHRHKKGLNQPDEVDLLPHLSRRLQTRAIFSSITDTAFYVYHQVWDNGKSVEHILFNDGFVKRESRIRFLGKTCVDDGQLDSFYGEQGIYYPDIQIILNSLEQDKQPSFRFKIKAEFDWCLSTQLKHPNLKECGKTYQLERSDFEGFDYITFED